MLTASRKSYKDDLSPKMSRNFKTFNENNTQQNDFK